MESGEADRQGDMVESRRRFNKLFGLATLGQSLKCRFLVARDSLFAFLGYLHLAPTVPNPAALLEPLVLA